MPQRYVVVLLTAACTTVCYIERVGFSVAYSLVANRNHVDQATKGWVLSAFYYGYALSQVGVLRMRPVSGNAGSRPADLSLPSPPPFLPFVRPRFPSPAAWEFCCSALSRPATFEAPFEATFEAPQKSFPLTSCLGVLLLSAFEAGGPSPWPSSPGGGMRGAECLNPLTHPSPLLPFFHTSFLPGLRQLCSATLFWRPEGDHVITSPWPSLPGVLELALPSPPLLFPHLTHSRPRCQAAPPHSALEADESSQWPSLPRLDRSLPPHSFPPLLLSRLKSSSAAQRFGGRRIITVPGSSAAQRYGGRRVITVAFLAWTALSLLTPSNPTSSSLTSPSLLALLLIRFLVGATQGFIFPSIHTVLALCIPPHEKSRAVSLTMSGMYLGAGAAMSLMPAVAAREAPWGGPAAVFRWSAGLGLMWVVLWVRLFSKDPPGGGGMGRGSGGGGGGSASDGNPLSPRLPGSKHDLLQDDDVKDSAASQ
ncbi:unnamed protein product [Closterium sp. Naga37s-1]|nr:unnamed protein product [Closterium sp. Naga37s-1]